MKLQPTSIPRQTSEDMIRQDRNRPAVPPKPPTPEAIQKAKFVDKTYRWNGK